MTKAALALSSEKPAELQEWVNEVNNEALANFCGVDVAAVEAAAKLLVASQNALIIYGPFGDRYE